MEKEGRILIVDDEVGVRESLRYLLRHKYEVYLFSTGEEAVSFCQPGYFDLAILDIKMPGMDGIEVLKRLKRIDPDLPVIMITGYGTLETAQAAINLGASGYISKPFEKVELERVIDEKIRERKRKLEERIRLLQLEEAKKKLDAEVRKAYSSTLESLIKAVNAKDSYTSSHSQEVADLSTKILCGLDGGVKEEEKQIFHYVVSLHDIGKIGVSEQILRKTTPLTPEEWEEIRKHPIIGAEILAPIDFLRDYINIVRNHHERFDGKGYPDGLKGEAIPLYARIVCIADAYHAMCSDRPYRKSLGKEKALEELLKGAGTQFDPEIVKIAVKILEKD